MVTAALHRREPRGSQMAAALIVGLGRVIGFANRYSGVLPGLAGAVALSVAVGEIAGHVFGHGLTPWVTLLIAGGFLLRLDGRIHLLRTPRAGNGRGG